MDKKAEDLEKQLEECTAFKILKLLEKEDVRVCPVIKLQQLEECTAFKILKQFENKEVRDSISKLYECMKNINSPNK
ncbi:hypothetical protein KKP97_04410 [Methanothermococcus sp. SCGC AD-155-C09]|nr:hypothetical protein [Methanothermococcus sp. SCGC AD-155-C09]